MRPRATAPSFALLGLVLAGCSILSLGPAGATTQPIQLARCDANPSALCLQSFGLDQNQLLITFYFPAAGNSGFYLKVSQPGSTTRYPCTIAETSSSIMYCRGPLIDLGTAIQIDLYTTAGRSPLAAGEFTLVDLALPTLPYANEGTFPALTPLPPTPTQATLPVGTQVTLPAGTQATLASPTQGTAYPNPTSSSP